MLRNKLMIGAAVAALSLGSSFALAQSPNAGHGNAPSAHPSQGGAAPSAAPMNNGAANPSDIAPPEKMDKNARDGRAQNKMAPGKSETTGQAPGTSHNGMSEPNKAGDHPMSSDKSGDNSKMGNQPKASDNKSGDSAQRPANAAQSQPGNGTSTTGAGAAGKAGSTMNASVNISTEQRTKIKEVIVKDRSAPRVTSVDFQINVGTVVPKRVKLAPVPTTILEIEPTWRGYEFFLVRDDIVIVEPGTLRIVAVIPA